MIITDPKKLSMPQQVQKNKEDIEDIRKIIDGLDVEDNVVVVNDISQILTAEELEAIKQPVAFIVYNNRLYLKSGESGFSAYFDVVFSITPPGTAITFASSRITANLSNGGLSVVDSSVNAYSVSQIDNLLSAKANITYVDNNFLALTGGTLTGPFSAPEIVEIMSGYSFSYPSNTLTALITYGYAGVVKNGNKITFVIAGNLTTGASDLYEETKVIGNFAIPRSVGENIYPINGEHVAYIRVSLAKDYTNFKNASIIPAKFSNTSLGFYLSITEALQTNTNYYFRFEFTLLLSDNLTQ